MLTIRRFPLNLQFLLALTILLGGSAASAQKPMPENAQTVMPENKVPGQVESTARRLTNQLDQHGYQVLRGYFKLYTKDDCDMSYDVMHTCYGNNPAAPYVVPIVPPWPEHPAPAEWVDPATIGAIGKTVPGYSASHRLDPHEALVILAQMPPPAAFFGLKTYLFTREGVLCDDSNQHSFVQEHIQAMLPTFFSLVPKEPLDAPSRVQIIADLSNSPNNVIIGNQSGKVWNQLRYFVVTPNPKMDDAIRNALMKIGIAKEDIFTEKIPGYFPPGESPSDCTVASAIRFGLDRQADDFITILRYAMPVDESAAQSWKQDLPMVVLRIRNMAAEVQTYPWETFEPRTPSNPPETSYLADLNLLSQSVCGMWNKGGIQDCSWHDLLNMQASPLFLTGPECVASWMNCLAPGEDATYQMSARLPLDDDHFYAVVGPLGTANQNATYVGLGLNSSRRQLGFDNIDKLAGSATGYSSGVASDKFFVQYFARDCSVIAGELPAGVSFNCYSIGHSLPHCDASDLQCDTLVLSLRGYIRPGTDRASDKNSVLKSRYILLKRP